MNQLAKVETYEEYRNLLKELRSNTGQLVTNCFILPGAAKSYIAQGKLFSERASDSLIAFALDRDSYYQIFLHFDPSIEPPTIARKDKPCMVENPYTAETCTDSPEGDAAIIRQYCLTAGFDLRRKSHRLELDRDNVCTSRLNEILEACKNNLVIGAARKSDCELIHQMMHDAFDKYCSYIPAQDELETIIDSGRVLAATQGEGSRLAFINYCEDARISTINHLLVAEELRGRGVAKAMLARYLLDASENIRRFELWVNNQNPTAIRLYESFGYKFCGRCCDELFLNAAKGQTE